MFSSIKRLRKIKHNKTKDMRLVVKKTVFVLISRFWITNEENVVESWKLTHVFVVGLRNIMIFKSRLCPYKNHFEGMYLAHVLFLCVITTHKIKFLNNDFFTKRDQIRSFLGIWSYSLKKWKTTFFLQCISNNQEITKMKNYICFVITLCKLQQTL